MYSYVTMERRIRVDHPARKIRVLVDRALERMDSALDAMYASKGRPSIPPERLLRAGLLLMVLYSVRSERQLMEQLNYNLLFRWFVGLEMDDQVWDVTVFTKNRERLIEGEVSQRLLAAVLAEAGERIAERGALHGGRNADPGLGIGRSFQARRIRHRGALGRGRRASCCCATRWNRRPMRRRGCKEGDGGQGGAELSGHALMENRNGLSWRRRPVFPPRLPNAKQR